MIEKDLKAPKDVLDQEADQAERVERFLKARKLRLSDEKMENIERDLSKKVESWQRSTNPLRKRLVRYNDLLEGVVSETNFPFEGGSNITIHYAAGMTRTFRASFNKTMYQDENLFVPVLDPNMDLEQAQYSALEQGFNFSFSTLYNGLDTLKEGTVPVLRDGTLIIMGMWERELEKSFDQRVYYSPEDFTKDYPDAESAGVTDEEYQGILDEWIVNPEESLTAYFDYDFVKFDGCRYQINTFAKFIFFPVFAKAIKDMELYGNEYSLSDSELKIKRKRGEFYERGVGKLLKTKGNKESDAWDKARVFIDGIAIAQEEYKPNRVADLVYKTDLDKDGIPEKYLVTFALDGKALLSIQPYPIRRNIDMCVALRIIGRENRFPGVSLIGDTEDLFNQLDILHRHRNNVRMLTTSPVFIANDQMKDELDFGSAQNLIRPGLTLWVSDPAPNKSIRQLEIQNLDQPGNSMDEEQVLERHLELAWGPTQGTSGQQTAEDPRAPARKTQMLLMQANQRIDDYMDEFRASFSDLAKLHAALLYQYYDGKEFVFEKNNEVFKFPIQLLASPKIHWKAKRRSVQLTPEFAMARLSSLVQVYEQMLPLLRSQDPVAIQIWNRYVTSSGEPDCEKLLYNAQTAQQMSATFQQMQQAALAKQADAKAQETGKKKMAGAIGSEVGKHMAHKVIGPDAAAIQEPKPMGALR